LGVARRFREVQEVFGRFIGRCREFQEGGRRRSEREKK
jgi:hypothetical protein